MRNVYSISVEKPEGKRQLGRSRGRCGDNIIMDLRGKRWEGVDWMHLAQNRDQWRAVVSTEMNLLIP
jgi:hypothetical protein